jgi:predicted RNA binding protein YcfA (HicA-like mRNA interferase family)
MRGLEHTGFVVHHVTGSSHFIWHNKDLKRGTLRSVIEQAGYTTGEFAELL